MFEKSIFEILITHPLYAIVFTLVLWRIIYFLFTYCITKEVTWKRWEYVYLFTGFLGIVSLVMENDNIYNAQKLEYAKRDINLSLERINDYLKYPYVCREYQRAGSSPNDFDDRVKDSELICEWSKQYIIPLDSITKIPTSQLPKITGKSLGLRTNFEREYIKDFNTIVDRLNSEVDEYNDILSKTESKIWLGIRNYLGVFFLMIALSLRLAITSHNVSNTKKKG